MTHQTLDRRTITQTTAREAIAWVRLLSNAIGCAGPPACEPPSMDVTTGKVEGRLCTGCEAREWLEKRRLL